MNFSRVAAIAAGVGISISTANVAQAAFVMTLDDLGNGVGADVVISDGAVIGAVTDSGLTTTVSDGGIGPDGLIFFNGGVGNFIVNVVTGVSDPVIGPGQMDLNSLNVTGGSGNLVISLTDTRYTDPVPSYNTNFGGTTTGSVDFNFLHDGANTEFGGTSFFNPAAVSGGAFSGSSTDGVGAGNPYSLTISAQITHAGPGDISSFDAHLTRLVPVPVPAAVWLFGAGVLGMAAVARRRRS